MIDLSKRAFLIGSTATALTLVAAKDLPFELLSKPRLLTQRRVYCFEMLNAKNVKFSKTGDVYFMQVEPGQFESSFIPTDAFPVTRAADIVELPVPDGSWEVEFTPELKGLLCSRSTPAHYIGPDNVLHEFAPHEPRLTTQGLLVEEARTNLLCNTAFGNEDWHSQSIWLEKGPYVLSFYGDGHVRVTVDEDASVLFNIKRMSYWSRPISNARLVSITTT